MPLPRVDLGLLRPRWKPASDGSVKRDAAGRCVLELKHTVVSDKSGPWFLSSFFSCCVPNVNGGGSQDETDELLITGAFIY